MKSVFSCILVLIALGAVSAYASSPDSFQPRLNDFEAPVVDGYGALTNQTVGSIVYDTQTNQFWGMNTGGGWVPMSYNGNVVFSDGNGERVDRLTFGGSTGCTTSPCSVNSQSGSWVAQIVRNSTGQYSINVSGGSTFPNVPTCTASASNGVVTVGGMMTTQVNLLTYNFSGTLTDLPNINVICQAGR